MPSEEERHRIHEAEQSPEEKAQEAELTKRIRELSSQLKTAEEEALETALARAAQAEAEVVELRGVVGKAEAAVWADPGDAGGAVLHGQLEEALEALASPSPVAEAMARVVEAAEEYRKSKVQSIYGVSDHGIMEALDALQAARKGEG